MAKLRKPITNPDTTNHSPEYWRDVLTSWGLSAEKGRPPRVWEDRGQECESLGRKTSFVGNLVDLQDVQELEIKKKSGKVSPSGYRPE